MMTPGLDAITAVVRPIGTLDRRQAGGNDGGGGGSPEAAPRAPQEDVQIVGAAIWQGDVVVGELTLPEAQFLYVAKGVADRLLVNVKFPPDARFFPVDNNMILSIESVAATWRLDLAQGVPAYTLQLTVRLSLHNYAGDVDLSKEENSALLEKNNR
ncbi:MAG: hypothetical protein DDT37_01396 [Firmicutes bacterium]|nr:hypothetical protein [candidate division NPL-UPA2 bacterium]